MWKLWARALGEKAGRSNTEADKVAWFRTMIVLQAIITNILISVNIIIGRKNNNIVIIFMNPPNLDSE